MDHDPDAKAIRQVLAGDPSAFGAVVERNHRVLLQSLGGILGDAHLAEDVAQETWMIAYRRLDSFRFESRFRAWLMRIAVREALSTRTRLRRFVSRFVSLDDAAGRDEDGAGRAADRELVTSLLSRLPPSERAAFVMHAEGFRYEEIARIMDRPEGTVATWIHRARQRLMRSLPGEPDSRSSPSARAKARSAPSLEVES